MIYSLGWGNKWFVILLLLLLFLLLLLIPSIPFTSITTTTFLWNQGIGHILLYILLFLGTIHLIGDTPTMSLGTRE